LLGHLGFDPRGQVRADRRRVDEDGDGVTGLGDVFGDGDAATGDEFAEVVGDGVVGESGEDVVSGAVKVEQQVAGAGDNLVEGLIAWCDHAGYS
jgi:hypothetical protein